MTKEEAVKILKEIEYPANGDNWEEREKAFDMAIKALSAEPCEDCISRQAVMNLMRGLTRWCVRSGDGKFNNVGLLYDDVMFGLDRLPSVTPKPKMGRLIKVVTEADYLGNETYHYECSECGFKSFFGTERYCQNCGAKMVESDSEEESEGNE